MADLEDGNDGEVFHILFQPFAVEETPFGNDVLDDYVGDVKIRLELYFGSNDEAKLHLAQMLISSYLGGEECPGVDGILQVTHHDETLPPTAFNYDLAPQWLKDTATQYRQEPPPALPENLRRLEERIEGTLKKAEEMRTLLLERLEVTCGALKHYEQGDDGERARIALTFANLEEFDRTGVFDV